MEKVISWNKAGRIKAEHNDQEPNSPERVLFWDLLRLAIKDLCSRRPLLRKQAQWWIYEDDLREVDFKSGYVSFYGACQALALDPDWVRKKLNGLRSDHKPSSKNGLHAPPERERKRSHEGTNGQVVGLGTTRQGS